MSADRRFGGGSMKAQMKAADRSGARVAVLVGSDELDAGEVTLRPLRGHGATAGATAGDIAGAAGGAGREQRRVRRDDLIDELRNEL